ncbi:MAG: carboxypeptidase-like regulatory domain-containing protein, partial [Planctomycetota bacterium]
RSQCELGAVTTGRGGAFEVRVAVPADGFVRVGLRLAEWIVLHDDLWVADGFAWAPCPSGANLPVELVVEPAGVLRDVVQPPGGTTFAFAEVVVADPDRPHKALVVLQSDFNGAIDVGLPPGTCEVLAISPDGEVCRAIVGVVPGTPVRPQWQAIATGTVEGTLRDERGKGLGGVEVFLGSLNAGADARASERYSCRVRTDRHGRFRCRGVPIGDWSIVASEGARSDSTAGIVERAGTLAVELSLPPR